MVHRFLAERAAFTGHRRSDMVSQGGACRLLPTAEGMGYTESVPMLVRGR
jgi:hypothetical protein